MKSYTDIEQSKKLAEILPLESADMWYHGHYSPWESERKCDNEPCPFHSMSPNWDKPCWSLAALLEVLPEGTNVSTPKPINALSYCCWNQNDEIYADNPIDCCVEMILKLNEQKLL